MPLFIFKGQCERVALLGEKPADFTDEKILTEIDKDGTDDNNDWVPGMCKLYNVKTYYMKPANSVFTSSFLVVEE